jgi:acetyltransferase EpsM
MERETGLRWVGTDKDFSRLSESETGPWFILGVGGVGPSSTRRDIVGRYLAINGRWANIIHAAAHVSPSAKIGKGVLVLAGAIVNSGAVLGNHCVINSGAIIEHDVRVGSFVQVSPGSVVGGGTTLEENCYVGLGARVRDHLTIGANAMVGMGAAVVKDVAASVTVVGVPAKVLKS